MYFLLLISEVLSQQIPEYPQWNPVWYQNFSETTTSAAYGINTVTGTYYYNSTSGQGRVDRSTGRYNKYCGKNDWFTFFDTPCTHLITNGIRYLVYPELNICCNCCSDQDGCGILIPNWLNNSVFLGQYIFGSSPGVEAYLWDKIGKRDNFYWETADKDPLSRTMLELDNNGPDDKMIFNTGRMTDFTSSVFDLPSYCLPEVMCDGTSHCSALRSPGGKSGHIKDLNLYLGR